MNRTILQNWTVAGFWPYTPIFGKSMETGFSFAGCTPVVPASVPGSIHNDLIKAGVISDPFFEMESLKCEWVSNRWWVYENRFDYTKPASGRTQLVFKGIDYEAYIYLNGERIAEHIGMNTECRIDVTEKLKSQGNFLMVILKSAPDEMGQIGYTSQTHTQKARFGYKWDYCTRLVDLGLYDEVYLEEKGAVDLLHPHIRVLDARAGRISISADIFSTKSCSAQYTVQISYNSQTLICDTKELSLQKGNHTVSGEFTIENPQLWYPNGYGAQPLYQVTITVEDPDGSDRYTSHLGLRDLTYQQTTGAPDGSLPYVPVINGRRIFLKGGNIPPLDLMYGRVTYEDYERLILRMKEGNFNIIRVWGGGIIEKEDFYNLCDQHGILVWQEFIQSSSGIDNIPSQKPEFLDLLSKTAHAALWGRRNHPSLAFWGGGNELMDANGVPSTFEDKNLAMLKAICDQYDPDRLMLPTSATGPREFFQAANSEWNHDVHGPWLYDGVNEHYQLYNEGHCQLHSEFGCNGMSSAQTIRRFTQPENQGVFDNQNFTWRLHGEGWNSLARDTEVVGRASSLEQMVKISQFIQAEAIRYAVEAHSRDAFSCCGSIIWCFSEPYPNTANCSLMDYYGDMKLAYYLFAEANQNLHCSMKYSSLKFHPGDPFTGEIYAHNDLDCAADFTIAVTATQMDGRLLGNASCSVSLGADGRGKAGEISFSTGDKPFTVSIRYTANGQNYENRYLFLPYTDDRTDCIAAVEEFYDHAREWALK